MDLAGAAGAIYHIAGLTINSSYTQTITLNNSLYVDVLNIQAGTIDGSGDLIIWQQAAAGNPVATNFGTSYFTGGTIKVATKAYGEDAHRLTLVLAGGTATPNLQANLWANSYSTLEWKSGNMTVGGGKTITVIGTFNADSKGTIGNGTTDWNLDLKPGARLYKGKGTFDHVHELESGGQTIKVGSAIPGGTDVFLVIGDITDDGVSGGSVEVQSGTLLVQGDFTQNDISTVVDSAQTLSVTGTFTITGGTVTDAGVTTTISAGSVQQSGGTLTLTNGGTLTADAVTVSGGTLVLQDGGIIHSAGDVQIQSGGVLNGLGYITIDAGAVVNAGTINVGGPSAVGALYVTGNYTQTGTLNVEINSTSRYDQLYVSGLATLGGTLNVSFLSGFMAYPGMQFSVLSYGSRSGTFGTISLPGLGFGHWDPRYGNPAGTLTLWVTY